MKRDADHGDGYVPQIAIMFPGVGSQHTGMGRELYAAHAVYRRTLDEASDLVGLDVPALCFEERHRADLARLEIAQIALVAVGLASYRVLVQEAGVEPAVLLGYSLGEYAALCASGALDLAACLTLIRERAAIINEVVAQKAGTMAWVTNIAADEVERLCRVLRRQGTEVHVSALDGPTKVSISGRVDAVHAAGSEIVNRGGLCIPIKMSGPFHSPLMAPAMERYGELLECQAFGALETPVLANRTARAYTDERSMRRGLTEQLSSPVLWQPSIEELLARGVHLAIEAGPKDVLKFLTQGASPRVRVLSFHEPADLGRLRRDLVLDESAYLGVVERCLGRIVATPNRCGDPAEYAEAVVGGYREIAAMLEQCERDARSPERGQLARALHLFMRALRAKRCDPREVVRQANAVVGSLALAPVAGR